MRREGIAMSESVQLSQSKAIRATVYQVTQCSTLSCINEITNYILWLEPEFKQKWIKRNQRHTSRCENWQSHLQVNGYGWCRHFAKAFSKYFGKEIAKNLYGKKDGDWSPLNVHEWVGKVMLPIEVIETAQQKVSQ